VGFQPYLEVHFCLKLMADPAAAATTQCLPLPLPSLREYNVSQGSKDLSHQGILPRFDFAS
jgi:hypothetical protein